MALSNGVPDLPAETNHEFSRTEPQLDITNLFVSDGHCESVRRNPGLHWIAWVALREDQPQVAIE